MGFTFPTPISDFWGKMVKNDITKKEKQILCEVLRHNELGKEAYTLNLAKILDITPSYCYKIIWKFEEIGMLEIDLKSGKKNILLTKTGREYLQTPLSLSNEKFNEILNDAKNFYDMVRNI